MSGTEALNNILKATKDYMCCGNCNRFKVKNVCVFFNKNPSENDVCINHSFDFITYIQRLKKLLDKSPQL